MSLYFMHTSSYVTDKRISQWDELLRKFSEAHKDQLKTAALTIPRAERSTKYFPTGSQYEGSWDVLGMSGYGVYTFPNGVIYEGDFEDGMFHGKGQLRYENGMIVRGKFVNGVLTERTVLGDNMEYTENCWKYCMMPDRRFEMEYDTELKPGGQSNLTAEQPTREIPFGYYDTGDGFYDPKTKVIYNYEDMSAIIRAATTLEQQWIVKNCCVNPEKPLGPCPDLYEEFTEPVIKPEPPPPPATAVKGVMTSFRTQSLYEDVDFLFLIYKMKSCRKHSSGPSTKYPCTCQWLCHMREFNERHKDKCNTVEEPRAASKYHEFLTGSSYEGEWQEGCGMHGYGVYTFLNGVIYEGEFFEGAFHGKGELLYQTPTGKVVIRGQWHKGLMTERTVVFDDALEHDAKNWQYCKMPDRRFMREYADGVQPSGKSFMTAYQPYVDVPEGYVDTGDGFFDIKRKMIYEHDDCTKILRGATEPVRRGPACPEQKWILENCRIGKKDMPIGPRQDLYEKYMEPTALLEPVPPPPANFRPITLNQSTWELYENLEDEPAFYDASKYSIDKGFFIR